MKRVLLDCDGVLADFMTPALATMNRVAGVDKKLSDMRSWYLFDAFDDVPTPPKMRATCYDEWKQPGWCMSLEPLPGACAGVARLQTIAEVIVVTSPMNGKTWTYEREEWLKKHFNLNRDNVIHTNAKYSVAGDFLVDDKTEHCEVWKRCHPDGKAIRWAAPTNTYTPYRGVTLGDWKELYDLVVHHDNKEHRSWTHRTT